MKAFILFVLFLVFSAHANPDLKLVEPVHDYNNKTPSFQDFTQNVFNEQNNTGIQESYKKAEQAIGVVTVPKWGENDWGTGFFISDKLFVTSFQIIDGFSDRRDNSIVIWIENRFFSVKNVKALSAIHQLAVLEIEGSYQEGALKLSHEPLRSGEAPFAFGFSIPELYKQGITDSEILHHHRKGESSLSYTQKALLDIDILNYEKNLDFHSAYLGRRYLKGAQGLPFLNTKGQVVSVSFNNVSNLVYAIPIKYLKQILKEDIYQCETMSIEDCLEKSLETLYNHSVKGDLWAQFSYGNRGIGVDANHFLKQSAKAGNALSQIKMAENLLGGSNCLTLPNGGIDWNQLRWMAQGFQYLRLQFQSEAKRISNISKGWHWLSEGEQKDLAKAYYLKGLFLLNGNCFEKNIPLGLEYLELAAKKGYLPAVFILATNYNSKDSLVTHVEKGRLYSRILNFIEHHQWVVTGMLDRVLILDK